MPESTNLLSPVDAAGGMLGDAGSVVVDTTATIINDIISLFTSTQNSMLILAQFGAIAIAVLLGLFVHRYFGARVKATAVRIGSSDWKRRCLVSALICCTTFSSP